MAQVDPTVYDPERYAAVKKEQDKLRHRCQGLMTLVRICPYCEHKVESVSRGHHSYTFTKCPNCGEEIIFPPVSFRLAR